MIEIPEKPIFTTGQIASLLGVSPRTINNWIDDETLPGFRLPDSLARRVNRDALVSFCEKSGFSVKPDPKPKPKYTEEDRLQTIVSRTLSIYQRDNDAEKAIEFLKLSQSNPP